ncbi:response regulator [Pedomonas mirosovicensis]|uniref:response regulator n=1 Tax=Pedomonas mirosovicensis TaxID=2908641 RepID=UPI00216AA27F|nr:response regulator [Pedomonas mirosovicensis]MCH8685847.1 response regulator [Pedomonas mirosovicensis]
MSIAREIQVHLPHLRRYARALLGTQAAGDAFVRACLEVILEDSSMFRRPNEMRITLYRLFQTILSSTFMQIGDRSVVNGSDSLPQLYRSTEMSLDSRQALLLTTLEGFTYEEAAQIMDRDESEIEELVNAALAEIDQRSALRVLIIEDEPIISMDLENLIEELGHSVVGVASTHTEAIELAQTGYPELILADIQLADGSSGLEAATDILKQFNVPVIFLTAFPERLLTGDRPEPAFLITKPFDRRVVKATIGQAIDVS